MVPWEKNIRFHVGKEMLDNEERSRVNQVIITYQTKMTNTVKETVRNFASSKIRSKKGTINQRRIQKTAKQLRWSYVRIFTERSILDV